MQLLGPERRTLPRYHTRTANRASPAGRVATPTIIETVAYRGWVPRPAERPYDVLAAMFAYTTLASSTRR
jgi:hypothetical protein